MQYCFEGRVMNAVMNAVLGLCVTQQTELGFEGRVMKAVLGFVCGSAEQRWTLKAELGMQCWVFV